MPEVVMDLALAEELIDFRIQHLIMDINKILKQWEYSSAEQFLRDSRKGLLSDSEEYAVILIGLIEKREKLYEIKKQMRATSRMTV